MILSQLQQAIRHWRRSQGDPAEAGHHGGKIIAAVEAILELGEPARGVLLATGSERGSDGALDVAEHRVDGLECRMTRSLAAGAGDNRLVHATRVGDAIEAAEPVGDDPRAARHDPPGDFLDVLLREPPHAPQLHAMRLAVLGGLDGGYERRLAGAAASALAAAALPAEIGIVH